MVAPKRRLPVLQAAAEPDTPARPPWQWSLFVAGLLTAGWATLALLVTPLATLALEREVGRWTTPEDLAARLDAAPPEALGRIALANLALHVGALGLAALAAGFVGGKWSPGRPVLECAAAGVAVGALAILAASFAGVTRSAEGGHGVAIWAMVVIVPWTSGLAAAGARLGGRTKGVLVGP